MSGFFDTAVVFGASGFVGHSLVAALKQKGLRTVALLRAPAPGLNCEQLIHGQEPSAGFSDKTVFFHLAAQRYDAANFREAQHEILKNNSGLALAAFGFCLTHGITEMRLASSITAYSRNQSELDDATPLDLAALPYASEAMYGWSKRFSEACAALYREKYGIHTLAFRLSNVYGPHDAVEENKAHVIPAFIIRALKTTGDFTVRGNPLAARDFIYVDDVVDVFMKSLQRKGENDVYNLGTGQNTSVQALAEAVLARCGGRGRNVVSDGKAISDVVLRTVKTDRVTSAFGIASFTSLETGLDKTVDWYRHALNA